ncbi:alpha/beta fold hydrolase [Kribbella sp. NPDC056345]|uniref:alpha/beta fold hydrolase n=1 Tax=Kribbella sp. NPDC056345 TaxID=3345789 RepID=UPI0035E39587
MILDREDAQLHGTATGAGPTVLLLHAGGEDRRVWVPIADILNQRGFRAVAYDLRGHGTSTGQATTLEVIADDVTAMIQHEPAPLVVVGASLGGLAAIASLPHTAGQVAGLVLVDVVPQPDSARVRAWLDDRGLRDERPELVDNILAHGTEPPAIAVPVLLVRAGPTSPLTDADVDRFHTANPTLTVAHIPSAGHLIAREAPAELAHLITDHATYWL